MTSRSPDRARIIAVLGPTNTGKTYLAVERMLGHRTGMIGFPLRLLAREIYDRVVARRGPGVAALVTGEEKRIPPDPKYYLCTVESMPLDKRVDFLAIDEIQLAADRERGHVFTDRLLHARGRQETMLLGSDRIRPLMRKLVPDAEYISRPRFSKLSYTGPKKLHRLPPRSAVVAFSVADVYAIAERMRREHGGAAVVLGALSPNTRNAQIAMYQAGEVDYLVATDAIGMGLNMDVNHIAFARLAKFDGRGVRRLEAAELAQIAGRAGRHLNDGSFGTTTEIGPLDPAIVEAVENHRFDRLKSLYWRNRDLRFASLKALLTSLTVPPPSSGLVPGPEADDHAALAILSRDPDVVERAGSPDAVRLLWEVCQIPDFRKVTPESHSTLLKRIYLFLTDREASLPTDWLARQIDRLDRRDGDIDSLISRIAHIRIWTYVSHRADWISDARDWQERSRAIEDRLSDALHEKLTQRFVDRRASLLLRRMAGNGPLLGAVTRSGDIVVEGHVVGRVEGFRILVEQGGSVSWALKSAARRILAGEMPRRVARLCSEPDEAFTLADDGKLGWRGAAVARLKSGEDVLKPQVEVLKSDLLEGPARERVRRRLSLWLERHLDRVLAPLARLRDAPLSGAARGLAFQLLESLGNLPRPGAKAQIRALTHQDRRNLARLGVKIGRRNLYLEGLFEQEQIRFRAQLWSAWTERGPPPPPPASGCVSFPADPELADEYYRAIGYEVLGPRAIRVDRVERLLAEARKRAREGPFGLEPRLLSLAGCGRESLGAILLTLGFRPVEAREADRLLFIEARSKTSPGAKGRARKRRAAKARADSPFAKLRSLGPGGGGSGR